VNAALARIDEAPAPTDGQRRDVFLEAYSYQAIAPKMTDALTRALTRPKPLPEGTLEFRSEIRRQLESRDSVTASDTPTGLDIVVFWKQNDTGLYGRRSDMLIKYLAMRPDVARVAVFDMPINIEALRNKAEAPRSSHDRDVFRETLLKRWGLRDSAKVSYHTFVYATSHKDKELQRWPWPGKGDYLEYVEQSLAELGIDPAEAVFWFYPKNDDIPRLHRRFQPRYTVVDVVDDHRSWPGVTEPEKAALTEHYREVLGLADLALANCETVADSMRAFDDAIMLAPNACETDMPQRPRSAEFKRFDDETRPKLGYVGNLEAKVDIDLLRTVAEADPTWQIYLIGSTHANAQILELDAYDNVHFVGVLPYEEARGWIAAFDVALIPHRDTEQTRSMNPLKLYVYCALGVPVVSTRVANLGALAEHIRIADDTSAFIHAIRDALAQGKPPIPSDLRHTLEANAWPKRVDHIIRRIHSDITALHADHRSAPRTGAA